MVTICKAALLYGLLEEVSFHSWNAEDESKSRMLFHADAFIRAVVSATTEDNLNVERSQDLWERTVIWKTATYVRSNFFILFAEDCNRCYPKETRTCVGQRVGEEGRTDYWAPSNRLLLFFL